MKKNDTLTGDDRVHRLTEMVVEEVSLVDRAANKRKFLVVKRASDEQERTNKMSTELVADGRGGFVTTESVDKAKPPMLPEKDDKKKPPMAKAAMEVPPGFKQVAGPLLAKVGDRIAALADAIDSAKEAEVGDDGSLPGIPSEFSTELGAVVGLMEKLGAMYPAMAPDLETAEEGAPSEAGEPPADLELRAKALSKRLGVPASQIAKVGAKMSKERFTRLEQAANVIVSLIGELKPGPEMGAAPAADGTMKTAKAEDLSKVVGRLDESSAKLVQGFIKLAEIVNKQGAELANIKKARSGGNSINADGGAQRVEAEKISWPLDMNSNITRESVGKSESFFDD